jgi:hypothetical protein
LVPKKGHFSIYISRPVCFPADSVLAWIIWSFVYWLAYCLSLVLSLTLCKLYTSDPHHFSSEDGDDTFLQNVGIYPWARMVSRPRRSTTPSLSYNIFTCHW